MFGVYSFGRPYFGQAPNTEFVPPSAISSILLTGSFSPYVQLTGSQQRHLQLTGSHSDSITLTGTVEGQSGY